MDGTITTQAIYVLPDGQPEPLGSTDAAIIAALGNLDLDTLGRRLSVAH